MKIYMLLVRISMSLCLVGVLATPSFCQSCIQDYHCVAVAQCTKINSGCQNITGAGISVSVIGSGGGIQTAYSYQTFGYSGIWIGNAQYKKRSTNEYLQ